MNISVAGAIPNFASALRGLDNGLKTLTTNVAHADAKGARELGDNFIARVDDAAKELQDGIAALKPKDLHQDAAIGKQLLKDLRVNAGVVKVHLDTAAYYTARGTDQARGGVGHLDSAKAALANAFRAADATPSRTNGHISSGADGAARTSGSTPHYGSDGLDELGNATRSDRGHVGNDGQGYTDAGEATGARAHDDYSDVVLF